MAGHTPFTTREREFMVEVLHRYPRNRLREALAEIQATCGGRPTSPAALKEVVRNHSGHPPSHWMLPRQDAGTSSQVSTSCSSDTERAPPPDESVEVDTSEFEWPREWRPPPHLDAGTGDTGLGDERIRVVVPDSHGAFIDPKAAAAFLEDLKFLDPDEIVFLGDHVDVGGIYSAHQPNYVAELSYSFEDDLTSCEAFLDAIQKRAPRARCVYLEGNHESHLERYIARTMRHAKDAAAILEIQAPEVRLRLKERGIRYCRMRDTHDGLSVPGTIRLGKAYFTHGFTASKFATAGHVARYGGNIIHGHTHRVQEHGTRTVASDAIGGWCPGTLALLQPLYLHTAPSEWRHGYGVQAVSRDGRFIHVNAPIINGWSGLRLLLNRIRPVAMIGAA